jgi:hypothetical protein
MIRAFAQMATKSVRVCLGNEYKRRSNLSESKAQAQSTMDLYTNETVQYSSSDEDDLPYITFKNGLRGALATLEGEIIPNQEHAIEYYFEHGKSQTTRLRRSSNSRSTSRSPNRANSESMERNVSTPTTTKGEPKPGTSSTSPKGK